MTADLILKDLLKLFHDEDLIRFVRRAQKREMLAAAELLSLELETREEQQKASATSARDEPQE